MNSYLIHISDIAPMPLSLLELGNMTYHSGFDAFREKVPALTDDGSWHIVSLPEMFAKALMFAEGIPVYTLSTLPADNKLVTLLDEPVRATDAAVLPDTIEVRQFVNLIALAAMVADRNEEMGSEEGEDVTAADVGDALAAMVTPVISDAVMANKATWRPNPPVRRAHYRKLNDDKLIPVNEATIR